MKKLVISTLLFAFVVTIYGQNVKFNLTEKVDKNEVRTTISGVTATLKSNYFVMYENNVKILDYTIPNMKKGTANLSGEFARTYTGRINDSGFVIGIIIQLKTVSKKCNVLIFVINTNDSSNESFLFLGTYKE